MVAKVDEENGNDVSVSIAEIDAERAFVIFGVVANDWRCVPTLSLLSLTSDTLTVRVVCYGDGYVNPDVRFDWQIVEFY